MAKAINWPQEFRDEVLAEDCDTLRCALRLGRLYYDNHYWVEGEVVDIRVEHLKVRKGTVQAPLKLCPIQDLSDTDRRGLKQRLGTQKDIIDFLTQTYQQPVEPTTEVTVVYYKNLPVVPEEMETPDDIRPA